MPGEVYRFKLKRDSLARVAHVKNPELSNKSDSEVKADERVTTDQISKVNHDIARLRAKRSSEARKPARKIATSSAPNDSLTALKLDSVFKRTTQRDMIQSATNMARQVKSQLLNSNTSKENFEKDLIIFQLQWHKIIANSMACIAMFLIGAPLGAIIKRGGLGVPFLVSIFFFIIFYVLSMQGDKLAKQETISVTLGVWAADIILFIIGLFFLRQARIDARLFEADFYAVLVDHVKNWLIRKGLIQPQSSLIKND
jgi:lipopolysaccharide export system permease protein